MLIDNKGEYKFFDQTTEPSKNEYDLWKIYKREDIPAEQTYSIYLMKTDDTSPVNINGVGFDVGENKNINVNYSGSEKGINTIIRTNGGNLTIDAEKDRINHYGNVKTLEITKVAVYNENGHVGELASFGSGKLVANNAKFCESREEIESVVGANTAEINNAQFDAHNYENHACLVCENLDSQVKNIFSVDDNGTFKLTGELYSPNIVIPSTINGKTVKTIGNDAFRGKYNLASIELPNTIESIGYQAFSNCSALTNITLPSELKTIGEYAFYGCINLKSIIIPDKVTTLGERAIYNCKNLTSVTLPSSLTEIGEGVFDACENLAEINVNEGNNHFMSIDGILFSKDNTGSVNALLFYPVGKQDKQFTVPDGVKSIGYRAFDSRNNLTSIILPNSLTTIGDNAFANCENLTEITLSNNLTAIGEYAFAGSNLTEIVIPDSVITIGDGVFVYCLNLTEITLPSSLTTINEFAFGGCDSLTTVNYNGTKEQWNDENFTGRDYLPSGVKIICSDGEIQL